MKAETKKQELTPDEKEYWKSTFANLRQAEQVAVKANQDYQEIRGAFSHFAKHLQNKYGFTNETQLSPDGEII